MADMPALAIPRGNAQLEALHLVVVWWLHHLRSPPLPPYAGVLVIKFATMDTTVKLAKVTK
ncbi:MAG: hypothetical protein EOO41_01725 [Methanobacteriota archaeon]|nr:MAG: hypothetical protein EOO41_01725 [Euryarchaeota archaeon]